MSQNSESDEPQEQSIEVPETDDVQALKAEIVELKKIIVEKDKRIAELEDEVFILKDDVKYYEAEILDSINSSKKDSAGGFDRNNYQPMNAI